MNKFSKDDVLKIIDDEDCVVVLRPVIIDGKWDGDITLKLAHFNTGTTSPLTKKEQGQMLSIAAMVASSLPVMNEDDHVYHELSSYMMDAMPHVLDEYLEAEEEEASETSTHVTKDGNVYKLNFNTKTKGNA